MGTGALAPVRPSTHDTTSVRVLILGEEAPGSLASSYRHAFASLGADVVVHCLQRTFARALPGLGSRIARRLLEPLAVAAFNRRLRDELAGERADLVLVLKGQHLSAATVEAIRRSTGAPVTNFYPDDPFSSERSNRLTHGTAVLGAYDACYIFARHLIPAYRAAGAPGVHYLPFARDPSLHQPVEPQAAPEFDVVFVGNLDAERVAWLEAIADEHRLGVFGERAASVVRRGSPLRNATFGPAQYAADLARTLARGAIAVNFMRPQNLGSHNMRSFESPACGAFTLSQRTPELLDLFREGDEIVCFGTAAELRGQVSWWLAHPEERSRVARAGHDRVAAETYARRAERIVETVGMSVGAGAA